MDEYETTYTARPAQTDLPLTLGELIDLIDFAQGDGTESFVDRLRRNADLDGDDPAAALDFVTVTSDFYSDLCAYYVEAAQEWIRERDKEPQFKYGLGKLVGGVSLSRAMNIFEFACNRNDTLFITESWFAPRLGRMRALVSDPVTGDQAQALCDVVMKHQRLDDFIEWLEHIPGMSWPEYVDHKAHVAAELERAKQEERLAKHMQWLEEIKARPRPACPTCGSRDDVVPIIYGLPESPVLPTYGLFVRGGCVISPDNKQWHCNRCAPKLDRLERFRPRQ